MSTCKCGNIYIPSSRGICPPCHRVKKAQTFVRLSIAREDNQKAKKSLRLEIKNEKAAAAKLAAKISAKRYYHVY